MALLNLIVIVTYNSQDFIRQCLLSLRPALKKDCHCIVLDNSSTDATLEELDSAIRGDRCLDGKNLRVIESRKNLGFAGGIDHAVLGLEDSSLYKNLILLNPDTEIKEDTIEKITRPLENTEIGVSGAVIMDMQTGLVQHAGAKISGNFITSHMHAGREYDDLKKLYGKKGDIDADYVTGALLATRMDLFVSLGGLDRGYRPAYFEELDYCLLLKRLGKKTVVAMDAEASHFEGSSVEKFSNTFYKYYHKNRIRCAIINLGFIRFCRSFLPTEYRWLKRSCTPDQKRPVLHAYFLNFLFLPYNLAVKLSRILKSKRLSNK